MAKESTQQKLSRVRPPRVHITYEVDLGGAMEIKELPFVMGVLGDFTGQPVDPLERMADRKFVEVTPDNFDDVLEKMRPHLAFSVENKLKQGAGPINVDLHFKELGDFDPEQVARQVDPLRELLDLRTKLSDLRGTLQTNARLDDMLHKIIKSTETREQLGNELGLTQDKGKGDK